MFLARVVGEVVATTKHSELAAQELLLVRGVDPDGSATGQRMIALDTVDAGMSDLVLVSDEGNAAAHVLWRPRGADRTVIVGVVDEVSAA